MGGGVSKVPDRGIQERFSRGDLEQHFGDDFDVNTFNAHCDSEVTVFPLLLVSHLKSVLD